MAGPVPFDVGNGALAASMQARVVAGADARIGGVEVMEGRRERGACRWRLVGRASFALRAELGGLFVVVGLGI